MPEVDYIDEDGITYYVDGSYRIVEGGDRYDAQGYVISEDSPDETAGAAEGEAAEELGEKNVAEPGAGEIRLGAGESEQVDEGQSVGEDAGGIQQEDVTGAPEVYEGVTLQDFEDFEVAVYSRLDALNTVCVALLVAVFMAVGVAAVDTLIRTMERI